MLYREPTAHRPLRVWFKHTLGYFAASRASRARQRRTETDLLELSPYLLRDLGLRENGYPR